MRAHLSAFLRTRLARAAALAATSLVAVTCHSEPTAGCTPSILAFATQPGNGAAGGPGISATVEARNNSGAVQTCFTSPVTISFGANPGGGTLGGTTTKAAVGGVASFSGLTVTKKGAGYTFAAASSGLPSITSAIFTVSAGPATALTITTQPTNAQAGGAIPPAMAVTASDQYGNIADGFTGTVTAVITPGTGTPGAVLLGTTTVAVNLGVATFPAINITKAGPGYTLTASSAGLTGATSSPPFAIIAAAASKLLFTVQPISTPAGSFIPAVEVRAQDQFSNTATSFTNNIGVAIGTNPATGNLAGVQTKPAVLGVTIFSDLTINKVGGPYTLTAAAIGLIGDASASFNIVPGAATQLAFSAQPATATAGQSIGAPGGVKVTALDAQGNTATGFTGQVAVAITTGSGTTGATLSNGSPATASAGVATFSTLNINRSGTGYTLLATAINLTSATSNAFGINPGPASQLAFTAQPANATAGAAIPGATGPGVQVTAQDALGNAVTSFTGQVSVAIGTNPAGGGLTGTTSVPSATAGVASFSNLLINKSGAGYTLAASATGLSGTSAAFNIRPAAATQLVFTTQPGSATSGVAVPGATGPTIQVTARDPFANTDTTFKVFVTVALGGGTANAALTGTKTVLAAAGVATYIDLKVDSAGSGYTLGASTTAPGVTTAASSAFAVAPAAATQLTFSAQPVATTAGQTIPAVAVTVRDAAGNKVTTFSGNVTLTLGANPTSGTLGGTLQQPVSSGVATFGDLNITTSGAGYKLLAASGPLAASLSNPFSITAGPASQLAFTAQPASPATAGAAITPGTGVRVAGQDQFGNIDPTFTGSVTVAIGTNGGGGTLSGAAPVNAGAGIATFSTLSINKVGPGYTLTAALTGLQGATSASFNVKAAAATQLAFTVQPAAATAGAAIPGSPGSIQVTAQDQFGNTDTTFGSSVTLAVNSGPAGAGILNASANANFGVATFPGVNVDKVGPYTLKASSGNLNSTLQSVSFNVTAATATKLVFTVPPSTSEAGVSISTVEVRAQDQFNNTATGFTGNVTVAIGTNAGNPAGTLSGTTFVASASAGAATFSDLSINKSGTGYTLGATTATAGVTAAGSAGFNITPAAATQLAFTTQPATAQAAAGIGPVRVTALDQFGNIDINFADNVTLGITGGNALATLSGGTATAPSPGTGVVTFSSPSVDLTGTAYHLTATAPGPITGPQSLAFDITPGLATKLAFIVQPANATAGTAIPGNPGTLTVAAQDALGNTVTGFTSNINLTIGTNPGTGTVSGTGTVPASSGTAAFTDARINQSGNGYQLLASSGSLTTALSASFNIAPAGVSASQSTVSATPSITASSGSSAATVSVTAKDAFGNLIQGATVVLASTGTINTITQPSGTTNASGVATGTLSSTKAESKTASATINGVAVTQTAGVTVNPTAVSATISAVAATSPITASTGASAATITVTAKDQFGNLIQNATVTLSATGTGNTLTAPGLTNAIGVATAALSSTDAGSKTVSATINAGAGAVAITQTASVTVNPGGASASLSTISATGPITASSGSSASAITVTAKDALGNLIPNAAVVVTVTGTGNTVTMPATTGNPSGVASGTLSSTVAELKNLSVSIAGATINQTASVTVNPAAVSAAVSTVAASSPIVASNGSSASTITVTAKDAFGNLIQGATVVLASTGTLNTFTGPSGTTNSSGVATATLSSTKAESKTVSATINAGAGAVAITQTANVTVNTAPVSASQSTVTVGSPITASSGTSQSLITVTAKDAFGNLIQGATVVLASTGTSNTLTQPVGTTNSIGVAFGTLSSTKSESKTVSATIEGIAIVQTAAVTVNPAGVSVSQSTLTAAPSPITASSGSSPATVTVTAKDQFGNLIQGATVALSSTGSSNAFTAPALTDASGGTTSSFSSTKAEAKVVSATINAGAGPVGITQTANVTVNPAAANGLFFSVAPSGAIAGAKLSPAVTVIAKDQFANIITTFNTGVTMAATGGVGTLTGGGPLGPDGTGTATFSNLSINQAGTYTLTASAAGVPNNASAGGVIISASTANKLIFTVQPGTATAGANNPATVTVTALDAAGNVATSFDGVPTVTLTITSGSGTAGASLIGGNPTVPANLGVATFTPVSLVRIDSAGTGYQLTATASVGGVTAATSARFNINAGSATHLVFTVQPTTATKLAAITPAVQVTARDALENVATSFISNVVMAILVNGGIVPGTLGGTTAATGANGRLVNGVATFNDLSINEEGTNYTLQATTPALGVAATGTSAQFDIALSTASRLEVTSQPVNRVAGVSQSVQVTAKDGGGTILTGFTGLVTLKIVGGGTFAGGATSLTATAGAVTPGVAIFNNVTINKTGTYTLAATAPPASSLAGTTSSSFSITPAAASRIAYTVQPLDRTVSQTNTVTVTALDPFGNVDVNYSTPVTVSITAGTGTPGATITGGPPSGAPGVAISGIGITRSGTNYTLTATSGAFTTVGNGAATSGAFNIIAGAATHLVFTVQPSDGTALNVISPPIVVTGLDQFDNVATTLGGTISLAIGVNPTGGVIVGNDATAPVNGVATFPGLRFNDQGAGYTLIATSNVGGVTSVQSVPITITQ